MRVTLCVDALQVQLSGIGRYTWELCQRLSRCDEISRVHFYRGHSLIDDPSRLLSNPHYRPRLSRRPFRPIGRLKASRALASTLVHGPNYFLPLDADGGVITVHDLSIFRYPETHPPSRVKSFERLFASSLARATHVITDSETIRHELIDTFSLPPEAVSAVSLAAGPNFRSPDASKVAGALEEWGLTPGTYGLTVAAFEPRKKIPELIAAWRRLPPALRQACPLVLAGSAGWRNERLHEQIDQAVSEGWLKHLGFVDEARLPLLYAGARLFIYPSIYEGFGLPPIEAMAAGTPVIVSDKSCLPEVCGEAAGYIDPDDPDRFTKAMEEALSDEQWRAEMSRRGQERARLYSWDRCVADTVEIYKKAWSQLG
jgi:alpha-1,3-rhamnosyl/mannosyltransferase